MYILFSLVFTNILIRSSMCVEDNDTLIDISTIRTKTKPSWNETYLDKLRNDLLTNYDKYARPGHHNDVTNVLIGISIIYLETDELNSTVTVASWLRTMWSDSKLKWNKDDYGGVDNVKMADHEIWQPDIYLYNSALGGDAAIRYNNPYALVYEDGEVLLVPPVKFTALCEFELYNWPYDTQHCFLKFVSWTHSGKKIKLGLFKNNTSELETIIDISPWDVNVTGEVVMEHYECCQEAVYNVRFNLTLTRKSSSYGAIIITPIIAIVSLILAQCCLPSQGSKRIILSCCTGVMIIMLLIYFTRRIAVMGPSTPWIVSFYSTSLYLVCFSLVESICVSALLKNEYEVPLYIKKHFQRKFCKLILLNHHATEYYTTNQNQVTEEMQDYQRAECDDKVDENDVIIKSVTKGTIQQEWETLTVIINRLLILIYSFIFLILFIAYMV